MGSREAEDRPLIRFHRLAEAELAEAVAWYERRYPLRGKRFGRAVEAALERIVNAPASFAIVQAPARGAPVRRFPYRVVYIEHEEGIFVLAVAHARRRPGYWRRR